MATTLQKKLAQVEIDEAQEYFDATTNLDYTQRRPDEMVYLRRILVELKRSNILLAELTKQ